MHRFYFITFSLAIAFGLIPRAMQAQPASSVIPEAYIDFSHYDFEKDGIASLNTQWEFYWNRLLTPDDFSEDSLHKMSTYAPLMGYWNDLEIDGEKLGGFGMATYRLHLNFDRDTVLSVNLGQALTSYKLWFDDVVIAENGKPGTESDYVAGFTPLHVPVFISRGEHQMVLQVANYKHRMGGMFSDIELGTGRQVYIKNMLKLAFDLFLFGSLFIMGIYHLGLFWLRRNQKSVLYFGLFSLIVGFRSIVTSGEFVTIIFSDISWEMNYKFDYLTYYLGLPLFVYFLHYLFPQSVHRKVARIVGVVALLFSVLVVLTSARIYSYSVIYYQIFTVIIIVYMLVAVLRSMRRGEAGAPIVFYSAIFFFLTILNDILFAQSVLRTTELAPLGLFVFIFAQAYLISMRFSNAFVRVAELSQELDYKNRNLEAIVNERTSEIQQQKEELETQAELLAQNNVELEKLSIVASETDNAISIFNDYYELEWVNDGFEKLYGYSLKTFIDRKGKSIFMASTNAKVQAVIENCIATKMPVQYEVLTETSQNKKIWIQTTLTPILDENDRLRKLVAIDADISEIKAAEMAIREQSAELLAQKDEMSRQKEQIEFQNQQITGSIRYAKTIQQAFLPRLTGLEPAYGSFILYRPKDIVSGDFYWMFTPEYAPKTRYMAAVDCTGHGVPGAFMSMLGNSLLNKIVHNNPDILPAQILEMLNEGIRKELKQENTQNKDGMDMALCRITKTGNGCTVLFSGAKRPLYIYQTQENKITTLKGDRKRIGGIVSRQESEFTNQTVHLNKGDKFYLTTDGYVDQNNEERKRFGSERFVILLQEIAHLDLDQQKTILEEALDRHQQNTQQRDDITILGVEVRCKS